jgi:hypothetical protein
MEVSSSNVVICVCVCFFFVVCKKESRLILGECFK